MAFPISINFGVNLVVSYDEHEFIMKHDVKRKTISLSIQAHVYQLLTLFPWLYQLNVTQCGPHKVHANNFKIE